MVRRVIARRPRVAMTGRLTGEKIIHNSQSVNRFNPSLLNLGDISLPCREKEAVAAVLDLTGFTAFCSQVDSYLAIPRFLKDFLDWFFNSIRNGLSEEMFNDRREFWADFPQLVKFLGDGVLLVWDAHRMDEGEICRLVTLLYGICRNYRKEFYPRVSRLVNKPPTVLRCGIARGKVFTIGSGKDCVGHCINNASRLSHLDYLTFCFPHRGFPVREYLPAEELRPFVLKYVSIRGVGTDELVWVVREEFERLPEKERGLFRNFEGNAR
jgi:class 3 adenylate cyclase